MTHARLSPAHVSNLLWLLAALAASWAILFAAAYVLMMLGGVL